MIEAIRIFLIVFFLSGAVQITWAIFKVIFQSKKD
jgi:hypothetical protein